MDIKLVNRGTTGELILNGRLDSSTADEAQEVFDQVAGRFTNVILNMSGLQYISSAGLRALKVLHMKINKAGGSLEICGVNKMVMEVLEMTGFSSFLKIV